MSYRKKLIEVALPLEDINTQSAREKEPFTRNHPRALHIWWAPRPLAACRAVLFASLVDDPDSDPQFLKHDGSVDTERSSARRAELFDLIKELVKWENSNNPTIIDAARAQIAASIASRKIYDTKEWTKDQIICREKAWAFVCRNAKPENVNAFLIAHAPPVLDPFCGRGSIPLEAQRLGLRAFGSDLNPVPVLITKALIEIPPKFANMPPINPDSRLDGRNLEPGAAGNLSNPGAPGCATNSTPVTCNPSPATSPSRLFHGTYSGAQGLAEDVRYYGQWMRDQAEKRIGHLYPKIKITEEMATDRPDLKPYLGEELTVIAWLWARTVASPNPAVGGAHVPLVRSFWLSTKIGKEAWVQPIIDRKKNTYHFAVRVGKPPETASVDKGTKIGRGCNFSCILSGQPIPDTHVKLAGTRSEMGSRLLAIVAEGSRGRVYLPPPAQHEEIVVTLPRPERISEIEAPLAKDPRNLWCLAYGLDSFDKLFTPRQLTALTTFSDLVKEAREKVLADAQAAPQFPIFQPTVVHPGQPDAVPRDLSPVTPTAESYADAVATYLGLGSSRWADLCNNICSWNTTNQNIRALFARQAIPMTWDFAEVSPFSKVAPITSSFASAASALPLLTAAAAGTARQASASANTDLGKAAVVSTDPPYYDNIGYADLSDFFYVWLRRSLGDIYPDLFKTLLTPKADELIATPYRHGGDKHKAQKFFEDGLGEAFHRMREIQPPEYPMTVFYAFKQSETEEDGGDEENVPNERATASTGWETMLAGLIDSGFAITGTWPMRTERGARSIGIGTNALASSIVLSCRPRSANAPVATRREFLSALKRELPDSLRHLQQGNIAPVDLAQASIGPGMAIYTRYAKVLEADGSPMAVRSALAAINQTLDEVLAEQEGEFDPDTRWAVAWFEQFGMEDGPFGQAETLSRAKNTAVNGLVEAGIISARAGKVRLLKRSELLPNWNPATDKRRVHWEIAQYLIRAHDTAGESAAADLLRQLGAAGEIARDLAYRLYNICERKKWPAEALAYNSLVIAWPEIAQLARKAKPVQAEAKELF